MPGFNDADNWLDDIDRGKELYRLMELVDRYKDALEKIADPRKRDHKEPDAYTELGCVMNIAAEALKDDRS